jgi:hypothetical protein
MDTEDIEADLTFARSLARCEPKSFATDGAPISIDSDLGVLRRLGI